MKLPSDTRKSQFCMGSLINDILCLTPGQDSNVAQLWQSDLWPYCKLLQTGSAENKSKYFTRLLSRLLSTKRKWSNYFSSWLFSYFTPLEQSHSHSVLMESDLSFIRIFVTKISFLTFLGPLWTNSKNDLRPTPGLHWNIKFN